MIPHAAAAAARSGMKLTPKEKEEQKQRQLWLSSPDIIIVALVRSGLVKSFVVQSSIA